MNNKLIINPLSMDDCPTLAALFQQIGWHKPLSLFEAYFAEQTQGKRHVFVGEVANEIVGYITIQWISEYPYFRERKSRNQKTLMFYHIIKKMALAKYY